MTKSLVVEKLLICVTAYLIAYNRFLRCSAIPHRGNEPWSVILCKFPDVKYEPRAREWFIEWMVNSNKQGDFLKHIYSRVSFTKCGQFQA